MASLAMLYLIILEPFLAIKLDEANTRSRNDRSLMDYFGNERLARFYLYTRKQRSDGSRSLDLDRGGPSFADFDPSIPTKVIIHGFLDSIGIADWMHDMKHEFLLHGNFNVIVVDWSHGNSMPYSRASMNTEKVGNETAQLIALLRDKHGAKTDTFHLIGHSLGSHVAGYVGERIKPLGRITGLDPAMFHFSRASPTKRLDPSDALFVDVIHTDSGGIGMVKRVGHIDFYPNGGSEQPGCTASNYLASLLDKGVVESVRGLICSHMRAIELFTESINSRSCVMVASRCSTFEKYRSGGCEDCGDNAENCAVMGYHAQASKNLTRKYFLHTSGVPRYCVFEYRLNIVVVGDQLSSYGSGLPNARVLDLIGRRTFLVTLLGSERNTDFVLDERNEASRHSFILTSPTALGHIHGATISWQNRVLSTVTSLTQGLTMEPTPHPLISRVELQPVNTQIPMSMKYQLCASPSSLDVQNSIINLRSNFC